MNKIEVDVVILGGGTSGVAAAIQAARAGVSVMVVEETKWLGGMLTSAAVSAIDGNYHLPSGIWGEFRQRLIDYYGDSEALKTGWVSHVQFEPHIGQQLLAEMISEYSSIKTMFGYYLKKVTADDRKIVDILISNETETVRVRAEIFIDADEYGDLVKQSNCRYYSGRDSREITGETNAPEIADGFIQDLTWVAILKDFGPGTDRIIPKPDNYKPEIYHGCHENLGSGMEAVQKMLDYGRLPNNKFMLNWPHKGNDYYLNYLNMDREKRNREFQSAREMTLGFIYYIQNELNFSHIGLDTKEFPNTGGLALMPYIRESRRIVGRSFLTLNDLIPTWSTKTRHGIAVGDYPLDHHHHRASVEIVEEFPDISAFSVPFGCLVPVNVDNLIAAEKNISVSHLVNGCTRLQPVVMGIGQAAGAAAAMSIRQNKLPNQLAVRDIQDILLSHNCYIVPVHDIPLDDNGFDSVQRIMATGIMTGESIHANWENRIHFNPNEKVTGILFQEILKKTSIKVRKTVFNLDEILLKRQVYYYLKDINQHCLQSLITDNDEPLTRLDLAVLIDRLDDPFHKEKIFIN